jgi:small subunit ribosomal protein S19
MAGEGRPSTSCFRAGDKDVDGRTDPRVKPEDRHDDKSRPGFRGNSIMARSVWKGPFVDGYLLNKAEVARQSGRNEIIRIWSRRSTILPQFVGLTFGVYNGHKFLPVLVNENMVGHKFGEFSPTRTFTGHSGDKKAKRS